MKASLLKGLFAIPHDWSSSTPPYPPPALFHTPAMNAKLLSLSLLLPLDFLFTASCVPVLSIYMSMSHVFHCLSTFVLLILPHCLFHYYKSGASLQQQLGNLCFLETFFHVYFIPCHLSFFLLFLLSLSVSLPCSVPDTGQWSFAPASRCALGTFLI